MQNALFTVYCLCAYSSQREKKDRRQFEKQLSKANELIKQKEAGKRAKFVKKSPDGKPILY